jgi:hypothetical protein
MVWKLIFAYEVDQGSFVLTRTQQSVFNFTSGLIATLQRDDGPIFPVEVVASWRETPDIPVSNDAWFEELFGHVLGDFHVRMPDAHAYRIEGTDWVNVFFPLIIPPLTIRQMMVQVANHVYATLRHRLNSAGNINSNINSNSNRNSHNNASANNAQAALQRLRQMPAIDRSRSVVTAPAAGGGRRSQRKGRKGKGKRSRSRSRRIKSSR